MLFRSLPGNGKWIDYQTGKVYACGWNKIEAGKIPAVILIRDGAVIPHAKLAQRTDKIDWNNIGLKLYAVDATSANGLFFAPNSSVLNRVEINIEDGKLKSASALPEGCYIEK